MKNKKHIKNITNFFFEVGSLKRIIRSGYQNLGSGKVTIAGHTFRCAIIGYSLAKIEKADENKVLKMCLFHDLLETRTGDLNLVNKKYNKAFEEKARKDQCQNLPFGKEMLKLLSEYEKRKTKEAILAKDADFLEEMCQEKEHYETGNPQALEWMEFTKKRLKTKIAKQIAEQIIKNHVKDWWWNLVVK